MINVEVKYHGKPCILDKKTHKIIKYDKRYIINEIDKRDRSTYSHPEMFIRKEVTQIFKGYKGIYPIKFYVNGVNK